MRSLPCACFCSLLSSRSLGEKCCLLVLPLKTRNSLRALVSLDWWVAVVLETDCLYIQRFLLSSLMHRSAVVLDVDYQGCSGCFLLSSFVYERIIQVFFSFGN